MALDPVVLDSIQKYKGRVLRRQLAIIILPILLVVIIALVMLVAGVRPKQTGKDESAWDRPALMAIVLGVLVAAPVGLFLGIAGYQRAKFRGFMVSHMLPRMDPQLSRHLSNGLVGVSIAAGIDAPDLVLMDLPGMSSISFQFSRGETEVGVTSDALGVQLSDHEVQGLMAHEVANILLGDQLKTGLWLSPERAAAFMPTVIFFALFIVGILFSSVPLLLVVTVLMFVVAVISYVSNIYEWILKHLFRGLGERNDLLSDSIAVKLTGNPQALASALAKLRGSLGRPQPTVRLFTSHLTNLFHRAGHGIPGGLDYKVFEVVKADHEDTDERLRNLEAISRGHWQAFDEVVAGEVVVNPTGWE